MKIMARSHSEPGCRPSDQTPSGSGGKAASIPRAKKKSKGSDWIEDLDLSPLALRLINEDPRLLSLLYDLDLLPEQLGSQDEKTPGLIKAYHRLYGVLYAYQAFATPQKAPLQGIEAEGRDAQRLGATHESPVGEADAPIPSPTQEA